MDNKEKIDQLNNNLHNLLKKQDEFSNELKQLQLEIESLKASALQNDLLDVHLQLSKELELKNIDDDIKTPISTEIALENDLIQAQVFEIQTPAEISSNTESVLLQEEELKSGNYKQTEEKQRTYSLFDKPKDDDTRNAKHFGIARSNMEKFIGENLINKIGIIIIIIGIGIGSKYAIDHNMVSPLSRIIMGYLVGLGLFIAAVKLKSKYKNFSAVLLSGAMASMYLISFTAFSVYGLFSREIAFILMLIFTVFTVIASINYDKPIIAHIGMLGAYAVPFLLSTNSGKAEILFSYIALINIGILYISFKKNWQSLYYSAFFLTFFMFSIWYMADFKNPARFTIASIFLIIDFVSFYAMFIANSLHSVNKNKQIQILFMLINAVLFYSLGYSIIDSYQIGFDYLGIFTIFNAIIHFAVSYVLYKNKEADKNVFQFTNGLVIIFITLAVPVQLDGTWVPILWIAESALLFWFAKSKSIILFEQLFYPLLILAVSFLVFDWIDGYKISDKIDLALYQYPILNIKFLSSIVFFGILGFINVTQLKHKYDTSENEMLISLRYLFKYLVPVLLIVLAYTAFQMEIADYWDQLIRNSHFTIRTESESNLFKNENFVIFKFVFMLNFTMLFTAILSLIDFYEVKSQILSTANLILNGLSIAMFLTIGIYLFSILQDNYIKQTYAEYYVTGNFNIIIRYISYLFLALSLFIMYKYIKREEYAGQYNNIFDFLLHISILCILSSEFVHLMNIMQTGKSFKLGLSIIWGVYSFILVVLGIWKQKKHLRIGAFLLFGFTLIKLFMYDIAHLNTIFKTIVFLSLGLLLLTISFLYNKYKNEIKDDE